MMKKLLLAGIANRKADATALAQLKSERAKKAAVTRRKNERRI
jgi:hypothetical protein